MSNNPKVSIVVPAYNVEKYIEKSLLSIINQTFDDYELIIINDGSTDNTKDIIKDFLKDKAINWKLIDKENRGVSSTRNKGIVESRGKKILFLDPDDIIAPNFIEVLYNNSITHNANISICGYKFIKDLDEKKFDSKNQVHLFYKDEMLKHFLYRDISFLVVTMLIDKSVLIENNIIFDEKIHFSEDQIFMWDIISNSNKVVYTNDQLYGYYLRENSTMTSSSNEKILNSYPLVAERLVKLKDNGEEFKYALPRWKIGALYTSARIMNFNDFLTVEEKMCGKSIFKELKGFKDIKVLILSCVLKISKKLFYVIVRKVN